MYQVTLTGLFYLFEIAINNQQVSLATSLFALYSFPPISDSFGKNFTCHFGKWDVLSKEGQLNYLTSHNAWPLPGIQKDSTQLIFQENLE